MQRYQRYVGWAIIAIVALLPIAFWIPMQPLSMRFADLPATLTSLGQLSALSGIVLYALVLVLSGRFAWTERWFGGLMGVYAAHHWFGGLSFILLLSHPLFLAGKLLYFSAEKAALLFFPNGPWEMDVGIYSLYLLMLLLVLTFFIKLPYNQWKWTHKILGLSYLLGGLHTLFISSDVSRSLPLRIYIVIFMVLGLAAYLYRALGYRIAVEQYMYTVARVKQVNGNVIEVTLTSESKRIPFQPGQFAFVRFKDACVSGETHPYSIASAPSSKELAFVIKDLGDYTHTLKKLKPGSKAFIEGPFGVFTEPEAKQQVWVAGGIGIVPFLSMARSLKKRSKRNITLFYSVIKKEDAVYLRELQRIAKEIPGFSVSPFYSDKQGFITAQYVKEHVGDLSDTDILLCGPSGMIDALQEQCAHMQIDSAHIFAEEFNF